MRIKMMMSALSQKPEKREEKTCHVCGHIHKGLKLKDRVYVCPECGYTADRDFNASLNLRDAKEYRIA